MLCQHVEIITSKDTRHVNADSQMHDLIIIILKRESGGQGGERGRIRVTRPKLITRWTSLPL